MNALGICWPLGTRGCLTRWSTKDNSLQPNADGGLTIYLGNNSPGKENESNWLPASAGNFAVWLRAYWPEPSILDGTWQPPVIAIVK